MKQITKILLCSHPEITSQDIVDHAAKIAVSSQAAIKVFHVIGGYPENLEEWWNVRNPKKLHDEIQNERGAFVDRIVKRLREKGVEKVNSEVRWGKEPIEVTREVMREKHDLVMLTARDKSEISKRFTECPSRELFMICPCVLWIAQQGRVSSWTNNVIAALPGTGGRIDLSSNHLPAKILESAAAIASLTESKLSIVHALREYGSKGIARSRKMQPDLTKIIDELRDKILDDCRTCLADYDISLKPKQIHLLIGNPSEVIPEFTQTLGADVIVMGTVSRSGIPGLVYGNTAEKVLQGVNCSILAVKPDEFVSPVTVEDLARGTHVN